MATSSDGLKSQKIVSFTLLLVTCAFTAVSVIQFKWSRDLRQRYEESQTLLNQLQTDCVQNSFNEVFTNFVDLQRQGRSSDHVGHSLDKRQAGPTEDPLTHMMMEMFKAQELSLLAHCQNNSKLCVAGPKGDIGDKGSAGLHGDKGLTGPLGIQGTIGQAGSKGQAGVKGDTGIQGIKGQTGLVGAKGSLGVKGHTGVTGSKGNQGIAGSKGAAGTQGLKGEPGLKGDNGSGGIDGLKGDTGTQGPAGLKGEPGLQGPPGPAGKQLQKDCLCVKSPNITYITKQLTYPMGQLINLTCEATGNPPPTVTWTKIDNSTCASDVTQGNNHIIKDLGPSAEGIYECKASNQYGTVIQRTEVLAAATKALDCNFEKGDMCFWEDDNANAHNWALNAGQTSTPNTGPTTDHTVNSPAGQYLYLESSVGTNQESINMTSLELPATNTSCMSFWYNMYGSTIGSLNAYIKKCDGNSRRVFHLTGDQGTPWHEAQIQLPGENSAHRLVLEAVRGVGTTGDIAVDDIQYYQGKCKATLAIKGKTVENMSVAAGQGITLHCPVDGTPPLTFTWTKDQGCGSYNNETSDQLTINSASSGDAGTYVCTVQNNAGTVAKTFHLNVTGVPDKVTCDFEQNSLCDWTQDTSDKFDWITQSGETQSQDTGPLTDHTLANANGKYVFIEASSPRKQFDNADLLSQLIPANQSACFTMWYSMYGAEIGSLTVFVEDSCTHARQQIWTLSGNQSRLWHSSSIDIDQSHVPNDYRIVVEATVGPSYHADIAIDDLSIEKDLCKVTFADCTFDTDTCSWSQSKTDTFDWDRGVGQTTSTSTGPDGDHTTNGGTGRYMFIEGSSPRITGDIADLLSPTIPAGKEYCFRFYYSMLGDSMGSMKVKLKPIGNRSPTVVFNESGQHGAGWKEWHYTIPAQASDFQIVIEAIRGSDFTSDAAIDDVTVKSGACH